MRQKIRNTYIKVKEIISCLALLQFVNQSIAEVISFPLQNPIKNIICYPE